MHIEVALNDQHARNRRQAYNRYVKDVVSLFRKVELSDIETLSFAEIAENIERKEVLNGTVTKRFRCSKKT